MLPPVLPKSIINADRRQRRNEIALTLLQGFLASGQQETVYKQTPMRVVEAAFLMANEFIEFSTKGI